MTFKQELLQYLERWSAPFSPVNPVEPDEIDVEMKALSLKMNMDDFPVFLEVLYGLDETKLSTFMEFAFYYVYQNADTLSHRLIDVLKPDGPWPIIELIGFTKRKEICHDFIGKINYETLDRESKFSFVDAFDMLGNKDAIGYLNVLKEKETDDELKEEIDLVISNLESFT